MNQITKEEIFKFKEIIKSVETENFLIKRVLEYAKRGEFTRYTSTLEEAWRLSIHSFTQSLITMIKHYRQIPELNVEVEYKQDPASQFGIKEARLHRMRGVSFNMFLALMKYYRQSYIDFINEYSFSLNQKKFFSLYLNRFFDRIEIALSSEWNEKSEDEMLKELRKENLQMTNEKNKYLTIFQSINTPVLLLNSEEKIENVNKKFLDYFLPGKNQKSLYYEDDIPTKEEIYKEVENLIKPIVNSFLKSNIKEYSENKELSTNIGARNFEIKIKKMMDISEKFTGLTIIFNDVTEFFEFENIRKHFISTVSHELRTPITSMGLSTNILKNYYDQLTSEKKQNLISIISRGTDTLSKLIDDLLILSRTDGKRFYLEISEFNIKNMIDSLAAELESTLKEKKTKLILNFNEDESLKADQFRIEQILRILLDNAIKYSFKFSKIYLSVSVEKASKDQKNVIFEVKDEGRGIPEEDKKNLFERFYRSDDVKAIKGSGLGLSIAKELVELHHGRIEFESVFGAGTTFRIIIPQL